MHKAQTHRTNSKRKLKVSLVSELVFYTIRKGLVKSEG
jgi:DNA-binding CsgD family transcriptional regulator